MPVIVGRPKSEVEERSSLIRLDLRKRYDLDALREQLYMVQEGICAICKKWMQDSCGVICVVDHAASVYVYASWNGSIEEACEYANGLTNLKAAHVPCNTVKREQDLEEFHEKVESGEVVLGEVPPWSEAQIQKLRDQLSERNCKAGRIGGLITGRKNVESGQLARVQSLPQTKEARRRTGRKNVENGTGIFGRTPEQMFEDRSKGGRKHVDSGHMAYMRSHVDSGHMAYMRSLPQTKEAQRRVGRKNVESGQWARMQSLPQSKEAWRINGRKAVESGHLASISSKGGRIGGRISGRKNVESGHLASICVAGGRIAGRKNFENGVGIFGLTPEQMFKIRSDGGRIGARKNADSGHMAYMSHVRHHINRGISKPDTCTLCASESKGAQEVCAIERCRQKPGT